MLGDVLWLIGGLSLLLVGGEAVVRGATGLARGFGVSPLTIGLTVVAFGTSAPELAVNVIAASQGRGEISFGSIIGSNLANIGLILGLTALLRPVVVQNVLIHRELPMMLLATGATLVMAFDTRLGGGPDLIDRGDGLLLLMLFGVFPVLHRARSHHDGDRRGQRDGRSPGSRRWPGPARRDHRHRAGGPGGGRSGERGRLGEPRPGARGAGGRRGADRRRGGHQSARARRSRRRESPGHVELATGNVIGSNIFNLLLVAGVSATVRPLPIPDSGGLDLLALMGLSLMLLVMSTTHEQRIVRVEAVVLLGLYLTYLTWRTVFGI